MNNFSEQALADLREQIMHQMSPKRFSHTVAVEDMIARLCALFCPEEIPQMRAAALLHDITKEIRPNEQEALCRQYGLSVTNFDRMAPKTFHARTAAEIIKAEYPAFATPTVVSAVRWHTTGREGMTLTEQLLYLADYIDLSRTFENCVILRRHFFDAEPETLNADERLRLLRKTLILSFDMTIRDLLEEGLPIAEDTMRARNDLLLQQAADKAN